jgi:plasmid maintenance system antidote protein VapI
MTNKMRAIHPGEILNEEYVKPLHMNANSLARALRVPATRISEILKENSICPSINKRPKSIDTTSPSGKLVFHIFASLAEFERNVNLERTKTWLSDAKGVTLTKRK